LGLPEALMVRTPKYANVLLEYQNYILEPPVTPQNLYSQASSNDGPTIAYWREAWLKNIRENKKRFGSFKDHSIGKLFKSFQYKPCIISGAGPSLKENVDKLKYRG